jgi:hypothetical protein
MVIACIFGRDINRVQNEWSLLVSLEEISLDCNMNAHCLHLWERDSSICKMVIACIFGRKIVRFAKWSLLASLGER